jgi:flagellar FliJ protein
MKKFKLDPVLNYRKMLENVESRKLSEVQSEKKKLLDSIDDTRKRLEAYYENLEKRRSEGILVQELMLFEGQVQHHLELLEDLTEKLQEMEKRVEERRQTLKEASRNKKLLKNLKDKFIEKEKEQLQKKEQAEIDEIAVLFHKR